MLCHGTFWVKLAPENLRQWPHPTSTKHLIAARSRISTTGESMKAEPLFASNVGLRHVVEDGLAILSNEKLAADRRRFVVRDLAELLNDALRGAQLANTTSFFVNAADRTAFDAYSLLDQLGQIAEQTDKESLKASAEAFVALRDGQTLQAKKKSTAAQYLKTLLGSLERQCPSSKNWREVSPFGDQSI